MIGELNIAPGLDLGRGSRAAAGAVARVQTNSPAAGSEPSGGPSPASGEQLEAQRLKALLTDPDKRVGMYRDEASGHVVMQIEDRATGEVVEQIPSADLVRLYAALRESLIDEQA